MTPALDPIRPDRVLRPISRDNDGPPSRDSPGPAHPVFFDEADSLDAARTDVRDAHDRYADAEIPSED